MYPQVDIKKNREGYFNYGVSIGNAAEECYARLGLSSIAECLHDAATALAGHFARADISYEGRALGQYEVARMEHRTVALADALNLMLQDGQLQRIEA